MITKQSPWRTKERGVYRLRYAGRNYYRLGYSPEDARQNLRRELRIKADDIDILNDGKKV